MTPDRNRISFFCLKSEIVRLDTLGIFNDLWKTKEDNMRN